MVKVGMASIKFEKSFWGFTPEQHQQRRSDLGDLLISQDGSLYGESMILETAEEATEAGQKLNSECDFAILDISTFPEGKAAFALIDTLAIPFALWSNPEIIKNSNIAHNSFCGANYLSGCLALRQKKCRRFFGKADSVEFRSKLETALKLIGAAKQSNGARIGLFGNVVPKFFDIDISPENRTSIEKRWNITFHEVDLQSLTKKMDSYGMSLTAKAQIFFRKHFKNINISTTGLEKIFRMYKAISDISAEMNFSSVAIRCWPELQATCKVLPCIAIGLLNENNLPAACEGDTGGAFDMLLASKLSSEPSTLLDIVDWDDEAESFSVWHCGPTAPSWAKDGQSRLLAHNVNGKTADGKAAFGLPGVIDMEFREGNISIFRTLGALDDEFALEGNIVTESRQRICGCFGEVKQARLYKLPAKNNTLRSQIFDRYLPHHYTVVREHIFSKNK